MKSLFLIVLLAAAATAAVVSNEVPELVEVPEGVEGSEVADVDESEMPMVLVTDADELIEVIELTGADELMDEDELIDETAVSSRRSLSVGSISSSDILAYNAEVRANGVANHIHRRDTRISTNRRVRAVRVIRLGNAQGATPSILNGGIGQSFVTIRIQSAVGRGYHYRIRVYVR